jgi:hypothetical protein
VPAARLSVSVEPVPQAKPVSSLQPSAVSAPHGPLSTCSTVSNVRVGVQVENV